MIILPITNLVFWLIVFLVYSISCKTHMSRLFFLQISRSDDIAFCIGDSNKLHLGDFNGDNRTDLLCHNNTNGRRIILLATQEGNFSGTPRAMQNWCRFNKLLLIGDFNGNGRDDMMCHAPWDGHKWIRWEG